MPLTLPATLSAGRFSRTGTCAEGDRHGIRIEIVDDASRITVAHVEIGMAEMMAALTNLSNRPCIVEWRGLDRLGWKHENKTEAVPFAATYSANAAAVAKSKAKALKPFEVDGWVGTPADLGNGHKATKDRTGYHVAFHRWVKP